MEREAPEYIKEQLCHILCIEKIDDNFGEPFIKAFSKFMPNEEEKVLAAAYTCSLFLSAILKGFPTAKLHTFVHFAKEHSQRFSFNCKMYDSIFSHMKEDDLEHVTLLGKENTFIFHSCSRQDIFEAFDFYTNG
ncbi:MAG: hypothetical protein J6V20_00930 [Bacteroidaceae bacterium]|nr:hypothetical protein [Bacteroidaceae bacterium]